MKRLKRVGLADSPWSTPFSILIPSVGPGAVETCFRKETSGIRGILEIRPFSIAHSTVGCGLGNRRLGKGQQRQRRVLPLLGVGFGTQP